MTTSQKPYSNQTIDLDELPNMADIKLTPLHPKYPVIAILNTAIFQIILLVIFSVMYLRAELPSFLWLLVVSEVIFALSWSYLSAKNCKYAIREHDIISRKGLWQVKTTAVSFNRIQHIDISNDPLERKYDVATIKLFTAGGSAADLSISGLPQKTAQDIRHKVLNKISSEPQLAQTQSAPHQNHSEIKEDVISNGLTNNLNSQTQNPKAQGHDNDQQ